MSILQKNCLMSMFGTCPHNNIILNVTVYLEHFHFSFLKFFLFFHQILTYNFFLTLITLWIALQSSDYFMFVRSPSSAKGQQRRNHLLLLVQRE